MLGVRVIHQMLGLERTVVEAAEIASDEAGEYLAVAVRPRKKAARRSGYHRMIRAAVRDDMSYPALLEHFGGQLGTEAKAIARTLIAIRDSGGAL